MSENITTTAAGLAEMEAQLAELEGPARREIADRIKTAREWGDLKENSEYHDAKNDQSHLETRIAKLRLRITGAVLVDEAHDSNEVGLGSLVTVIDEAGKELAWRIAPSHEAVGQSGLLSIESPVARALLGKSTGTEVTVALPRGQRTLRIASIA